VVLALPDALDGGLGLVHEGLQAVGAQRAEELLLAAVAGVQGADADAGVLGHRGDRRAGIGDEHRPGRLEDALVVAGRFGLAAAHRPAPASPAPASPAPVGVGPATPMPPWPAAWPRVRLGHENYRTRRLERIIPF
jgi:hypothetical protein